jgi:hypothetical protein
MFRQFPARLRARRLLRILTVLVLVTWAATAVAQPATDVVRVEQDWELVLATPNPSSDAPQVTCVISPLGNVEGIHAAFELNQRTMPGYVSGGMQLQLWDGEVPLSELTPYYEGMLATPGEVVSWTQAMYLGDGRLTFEIINGHSTTWGNFGWSGLFKVGVASNLSNLDNYKSDVSAANSGAGYAVNRVQSLTLKRVRYYTSNQAVVEDAQARVIHSQP